MRDSFTLRGALDIYIFCYQKSQIQQLKQSI
nr:MAG TPA_asm: hypothetical protein [Caudoviricetes sp.]